MKKKFCSKKPKMMNLNSILYLLCNFFLFGCVYFAHRYPQIFAVAFTMSLTWVLFYGYSYKGTTKFKIGRINIIPLLAWTFFLMLFWQIYNGLQTKYGTTCALLVCGLLYYFGLFIIEWIGYHILGIKLAPSFQAMPFNVIHGPWYMKLYYLIAWILFLFFAHNVT